MPWQGKDAKRHTKAAKSAADQKLWSAVANSVLNKSGDEGRAVRIANAQVSKGKTNKKSKGKVPPQFMKKGG
jgi:hypothetical protein